MKRVLLTGMSGTGKSTLVRELAARGHKAVDLDADEWSAWVPVAGKTPLSGSNEDSELIWRNQDWLWREDRIERLLSTKGADALFVSGTAPNQGKFRTRFDHVILLSAPTDVLVERLSSRTANAYGKHPSELARVLEHVHTVEPLLRHSATMEIDTSAPLGRVIETILSTVLGAET